MSTTIDHEFSNKSHTHDKNSFSKKAAGALIRPAWTPITIAMMIIGFMVYWPFGLAVIAYILWGDRLDALKSDISRATDNVADVATRGFARATGTSASNTGNVAFDEWRNAEIERLEKERHKLDQMRDEFDAHLRELHRARDRQEFENFMAKQKKSGSKAKTGIDKAARAKNTG